MTKPWEQDWGTPSESNDERKPWERNWGGPDSTDTPGPTGRKSQATAADYLRAADTGFAQGITGIGAAAGTILQDPGGAIVSGLTGARALADRGITHLINAVDPGAAQFNTEQQRAAQIASEVAADRRAANAADPLNLPARLGQFMEQDSRRVTEEIKAKERADNPELIAQQEEVAKAEGFFGKLGASVGNPLALTNTLARSAPDMAAGVGVGATLARAGAGMGGVSAAGTATEAASSGMQAREGTYQQVAGMPLETLAQSPRFNELLQAYGGNAMQAREALANELADQTPVLSALGTAAGTALTNRLFGGDATAKSIMGVEKMTAREFGKRVAQDTAEEGFQGVPEDTVQHGAVVQADVNKKWDPAGSLAENMVAGLAMGAGGHGLAYARENMGRTGPTPAPAPAAAPGLAVDVTYQTPDGKTVTSTGSAGASPSVATADTTEAEKALRTPVTLTALDRANEIDGEVAGITQRLATLTPENGYGPTFDQERQELAAQAAELERERAGIAATWPKAIKGAPTAFSTEAGVKLDGEYALMDAGDLITSHTESLRPNPLYPQELQPRDRSRNASEMQVSGIVQKLDPARLGLSADAGTGAPIVGADGLVESGNARTIAMKRVYQANGQKAADYKQFLRDNAAQFGLAPEAVDAMDNPVLVRVRSTPVNRAEFARQANASTVQRMSPSEQALSDAKRLNSLDGLNPTEDGDFSSSNDFIRQFMATLPITEQSDLIESDGRLSTAGYRRIQNAVLARAYGDSPSLRRMTESMDNNLVNVSKALLRVAPTIAAARERMQAGTMHQADIAPDLLAAVEGLSALKEKGWTVAQELAQVDLTGPKYTPEAAELLGFLSDNIRSPRRIAEFFQRYYEALEQAGDPTQPSMFGDDGPAPARADLLKQAQGATNGNQNDAQGAGQDAQRGVNRESAQTAAQDGRRPQDAPGRGRGNQGDGPAGTEAAGGQPGQSQGQAAAANASEWVAFPAESGTLGIPRSDMPQVKGEHRGALINFLKARGIESSQDSVDPNTLKPTQAEFSTKKVAKFTETGAIGERSVLVSSDGHVLDGHHQWMGHQAMGDEVPVIRLDAPIKKLLATVREFPSVQRSDGATAVANDAGDRAQAVTDFKDALADLAQIASKHTRAAMVPENTPELMPTLVKLYDAGIKLLGTDLKILKKWVGEQLKKDARFKTFWNKISNDIHQKAALQALDQMDAPAQAGLFDSPEAATSALQSDLFAQPPAQPAEPAEPAEPAPDGVALDLDGVVIRHGKGLIKGKFLAEVDGQGVPSTAARKSPFDTEQEAAAIEADLVADPTTNVTETLWGDMAVNVEVDDASDIMLSRSGAQSGNANQKTSPRAWYDRLVGLLPASYRNDPHRREPLPTEDWNVQRAGEVRAKVEALNKQLRGADDRKGYGPVSIDSLGNLQADARDVSAADLSGRIKTLADDLGAGVVVTGVKRGDTPALHDAGFVSEASLAAIADRLMGRPFVAPANVYAVRAAGAIMSYKPRGFPLALFSRASAPAGGGASVEGLAALAERLRKAMPNMPRVNVLADPSQAPKKLRDHIAQQGATADVEGALHGGELYLFASGLRDMARAEHVLAAHEAAHFGLRAILAPKELKTALRMIWVNNAKVRKAATELQRRGKLTETEATEEVIVDIPSAELARLKGWRKVVQAVADYLGRRGYSQLQERLAGWLAGTLSEQQRADLFVADLVRAARAYVQGQRPGMPRGLADATRLSGSLAEDLEKQEQWLAKEARARGYKDIDTLVDQDYPLFEKLANLWREKNPADEGVLLSRGAAPKTAIERAEAIIQDQAASAAPLDAAARALTRATGVERLTGAVYNKAAQLLDRYTPERVKAGVLSDYGVPEAVIDQRTLLQSRQRVQLRKAGALIEKLATLTRAESRVAYEWMNMDGADPQAYVSMMQGLPEESVAVLQEVQQMVDKLSQDAVRLGQLDPEAFARNRFAYLRRSYAKHTLEQTRGEKARRARTIAVLGEQYKGRGMSESAPMAKIQNVAPEWWGRKLKAGKADAALKGEKFVRLERRAASGEGTRPLDGMAGKAAGKLREVIYLPAGEKVPPRFADWTSAGTWEVRDVKGGNAILWRDFTKDERESMGEIDEARFAIAKTMHAMIHDVEVGRYLEWLAARHAKKEGETIPGTVVEASERMRDTFAPGEWVRVPDSKIQGTNVPKYGKLAGRYLPGPVWNDLRQVVGGQFQPFGETYSKILSLWKTSKTALSPAVHMNNVMSNFVMADWHDVHATQVGKALRILLAASQKPGGMADREAAVEILNRYKDSGGDAGSWVTQEISREQIEPLLESLQNELAATNGQSMAAQTGIFAALQHAMQLRFPEAWDAAKAGRGGKTVAAAGGALIDLYQSEDDVFRLAAWLAAKERGATDMEAGKLARKSFLDYNINAPWINAMRKSAWPFLSFTYRAVPMLLETAAKKPHKIMKLMALAGALNALGVMLAGGGGDDDERKMLPEEKAGGIWGMAPKLIRMPWNDAHGSPVYLDIRRWVPVGDVLDVGQGHAAVPILPGLMPGGPLVLMGEVVLNRSAFTGKPITLETDTPTQQAAKLGDYLYKSFAPNILGLPNTYATEGVVGSMTGRTDAFGREMSTAQAVASSFGVKVGSYPADVMRRNLTAATLAQTSEIDKNISQLKRQLQTGRIDQAEFQDLAKVEQEKKVKLMQKLAEKTR